SHRSGEERLVSGVDLVDREVAVLSVAGYAAFAVLRAVDQGVDRGGSIVMATLAGRGDRTRRGSHVSRSGDGRHGSDVIHLVRIVHMAGTAIAQVAGIPDFLIIGGSQDIRIGEAFAAMGAVDLGGEADRLLGGAVGQGGVVADHAFLGIGARSPVDK